MHALHPKKSSRLAAALRFILPGLIALLLLAAPVHGASGQPPGGDQTSPRGEPGVTRGSGWGPSGPRCPLPPASAFSLQTNLHTYLETWPTPGSTSAEDWPEYVPEEGEGVD
jgi:hypothetical protein